MDNKAQSRRRRAVALIIAAAPAAAAAACTAAPLAAAIGAPSTPESRTMHVADECNGSIHFGALDTVKWPQCAGD